MLIQVATQVFPFFEISNGVVRLVILLIVVGFPIAVVCAWAFELTPEGIKRTEAVDRDRSITRQTGRKLTALIVVVAFVAIGVMIFRFLQEIDPRFFYDVDSIASVYAAEGRWQEAITRYESLPAGLIKQPNFRLAICYAHMGRTDRARRILTDLETLAQHRYVDQAHLAAIYAALGEKEEAFAALDRACDDRSARVSTPRFYSWLAPLFDDPRFAALEEKVRHSAITSTPQPGNPKRNCLVGPAAP